MLAKIPKTRQKTVFGDIFNMKIPRPLMILENTPCFYAFYKAEKVSIPRFNCSDCNIVITGFI